MEIENKKKRGLGSEDDNCPAIEKRKRQEESEFVRLWVTFKTDIGDKPTNEDRIRCARIKDWKRLGIQSTLLCLICDGHGGSEASSWVSENLFDRLFENLKSVDPEDIKATVAMVFMDMQEEMRRTQLGTWPKNQDIGGPSTSGTTVTLVMIISNILVIANVGDSPVVAALNRNGMAVNVGRFTKDHKPKDKDEASKVESRGGNIVNLGSHKRVCLVYSDPVTGMKKVKPFLGVTRALGDFWSFCPKTKLYTVSPIPDVTVQVITDDMYIAICSDGITDVLSDFEIMDVFSKHQQAESEATKALKSAPQSSLRVKTLSFLGAGTIASQIVDAAKARYKAKSWRADNLSVIAISCAVHHQG